MARWRVGVIGAGPGVSALHLPTLSRLDHTFVVRRIADGGSGRAGPLAAAAGATASASVKEMLGAGDLDVVLVASPPERHVEHIEAACRAGIGGLLVEKPFGTSTTEAERAVEICRQHGVALVVGTNHLYDPGWDQAWRILEPIRSEIRRISVSVALPPNGRYHRLVTETDADVVHAPRRLPDWHDRSLTASVVRQLVLGLANHDLPAVRRLLPDFEGVDYAGPTPPLGYVVGFRASGALVQILGVMLPGGPDAHWRMCVGTSQGEVELEFQPAFVHAGSASVRVRDAEGGVRCLPTVTDDGYQREWKELAAQLEGSQSPDFDAVLSDARFALAVADGAARAIEEVA